MRKSTVAIMIVLLTALGVIGVSVWRSQQTSTTVNSFDECAAAGYPVMESYPRQCRTSDGRSFTEEIVTDELGACVNSCGDGQCAEIVCLGTGCPCAETASSCPQDC